MFNKIGSLMNLDETDNKMDKNLNNEQVDQTVSLPTEIQYSSTIF